MKLNINLKDEKKRFIVIGVGIACLLILDSLFIIRPLIKKASHLTPQIRTLDAQIKDIQDQISMLDVKKKKFEVLTSEQTGYERRFPGDEEIPSLLQDLSKIAADSGVNIIAISPVKRQSRHHIKGIEELFYQIPINIRAQGGYHQFGQFINSLEKLDRFIELQHIEIKRNTAAPRSHLLRILAATYVLRS